MAKYYKVSIRSKLLPFLFEILSINEGWSKKRVKQRLQSSSVLVNGQVQTKHDFILNEGDVIEVGAIQLTKHYMNNQLQKLEIIYQDKDIIAINKPAGLLSVGTARENKNHALALLRTQLTKSKKLNNLKLWPVHRLDRETSGILLFATSKEIREAIMDKWNITEKTYLAVVEGITKVEINTITEPLRLDAHEYRMHVGKHKSAKSAITHYKTLKSYNTRSLLEVRIETGRQHQIRAHMAWIGNPIVGDERYGNKGERMGLHATRLKFLHPVNQKEVSLEIDAPSDFHALLK